MRLFSLRGRRTEPDPTHAAILQLAAEVRTLAEQARTGADSAPLPLQAAVEALLMRVAALETRDAERAALLAAIVARLDAHESRLNGLRAKYYRERESENVPPLSTNGHGPAVRMV